LGAAPNAATAPPPPKPIFRLTIQAVSRGIEGVSRVHAAAVKAYGDDLLQLECFVVQDDAHPANIKK
jgi:hypothetical protein